jgi:hypothetical protein
MIFTGYLENYHLNLGITSEELSSGMLRRVALVRTDVSEEPGASLQQLQLVLFLVH